MDFSYFTRKRELEGLNGNNYDVVIVGGGIAGAGIASILSTNGLKVFLVDKGDFGSGTSSNSSKLIHGGLRYLGQGHLLLTRELLKERNYLLENLDIVKKMQFNVLVDENSWSKTSLYLGLFLYNLLGGSFRLPRFQRNRFSYPGYHGYFSYDDASTDDALLVIYNIVSSVMQGASALNYLEATKFTDKDDHIETILNDKFDSGTYAVSSKIVVNAAGPWANLAYENYTRKKIENLRLSRGSHLLIRNDKLNLKDAIVFISHLDRRQMFVIPRGSILIVGTTDEFVDKPDSPELRGEEREYIVNSVRTIFPSISNEDVVGSYSGIRPLYGKGNDPGRVTRDFHVDVTGKMITIMGVKITNYRNASRKISRQIGKFLHTNLVVDGLPEIVYRRENQDPLESALKQECALTVEDIIRRRLGYFYSTEDQGRSHRDFISEKIHDFMVR